MAWTANIRLIGPPDGELSLGREALSALRGLLDDAGVLDWETPLPAVLAGRRSHHDQILARRSEETVDRALRTTSRRAGAVPAFKFTVADRWHVTAEECRSLHQQLAQIDLDRRGPREQRVAERFRAFTELASDAGGFDVTP